MKNLLFPLLLLALCGPVWSQAYLIEKESKAFGFSYGYASSDNVDLDAFGFTYCPDGKIELGLVIGKGSVDSEQDFAGLSSTAIVPNVAFYPVKQDDHGTEITLGVSFAYQFVSYSGEVLERNNVEIDQEGYAFGFGLFRDFIKSPSFSGVGILSLTFGSIESKVKRGFRYTKVRESMPAFGLQAGFSARIGGSILTVTPGISVGKRDNVTLAIDFGIIFLPKEKQKKE